MNGAAISVEGLTKRYDKVAALSGIDFEVPAGTVFGLLGPNGAGKTTAVRVLATILRPDAGRAEVMGYDVVRAPPPCASRSDSPVRTQPSTGTSPGARTCASSARWRRCRGARSRRELRSCSSASTSAAPPTARCAPTRVGCAAGSTSRRRSSSEPPVLFLDEPTTGLDTQSRTELWTVIRELVADGSTVLLTTQYLEEADRLADRIAVIDQGRIVANDTAKGLKARVASTVIEIGMETEEEAGGP